MECDVVLWVTNSEVVLRDFWLGRVEHRLVADEPAIVTASFNTPASAAYENMCELQFYSLADNVQ